MEIRRKVTRLCLVLPAEKSGRPAPAAEAAAELVQAALSAHGVQVMRRIAGSPADSSPRMDVALWWPLEDGDAQPCDPREVSARVHACVVATAEPTPKHLGRTDAIVVPHAALVEPAKRAAARAPSRTPAVVTAQLTGEAPAARDAEKSLRRVAGQAVLVLDVRDDFEAQVDRVVFQLALKMPAAAAVVVAPKDERARARVRSLCERHQVDLWLAAGDDGLVGSVAAADLFVGRPRASELLLLAQHRVAVSLLGEETSSTGELQKALKKQGAVDEIGGVLHLAAALERRLADPGALHARGLMLKDALLGSERALLDALASLEPAAKAPLGAAAWEAVGPHAAQRSSGEASVVEAKHADEKGDSASKIEDALSALKAKLAQDGA